MTQIREAAGMAETDPGYAPFPDAKAMGGESWAKAVDLMFLAGRGRTSFELDGRKYELAYWTTNGIDIVGTAVPSEILFADIARVRTDLLLTLGPLVAATLLISAWFASA